VALDNNIIITGDSRGRVTGFDHITLKPLWTVNANKSENENISYAVSNVVVFQNKLYAAVNTAHIENTDSNPSYVRVWDLLTRNFLYDVKISDKFISRIYSMDVCEDFIIIGGTRTYIIILDTESAIRSNSLINCCIS